MDQIQKIMGGSLSLINWISFELTFATARLASCSCFQRTYEELKQEAVVSGMFIAWNGFQRTYEELKPAMASHRPKEGICCFQRTYEELKLRADNMASSNSTVFSVPMRN